MSRALLLFSGGLDSMLAACVLREQGVEVEGVCFVSPFFGASQAIKSARVIDLPLRRVDFSDEIISLVENPAHGFGGAMNPCIDCHALMIRRAGEIVRELGWDFVATGEVLNQRPMSQNRRSLEIVANDSGCGTILRRPLCEIGLNGRSRKPQAELAAKYGIKKYPAPAGGCALTEKLFCNKLRDLKAHEGLGDRSALHLLKIGRHFRLPNGSKAIVGRNESDNLKLQAMHSDAGALILRPVNVRGATVLVTSDSDLALAADICAAYADNLGKPVYVRFFFPETQSEEWHNPQPKEAFKELML